MCSSTKSPVFPTMPEPHPFNDYGFDPQLDFFQVLGEARRHRQHCEATAAAAARTRDHSSSSSSAVRFKLQKLIAKDQEKKKNSKSSRSQKPRWSWLWRSAVDLFFFTLKWPVHVEEGQGQPDKSEQSMARPSGHSFSGPLYLAESRNTAWRPRKRASSQSGPLAARVPYMCLSMDVRSTVVPRPPPPPLYLVT